MKNFVRWWGWVGWLAAMGWAMAPGVQGADWPQWMGPQRDGSTQEKVRTGWAAEGPRVAWSVVVGRGYSGPVISGGRLVLHHRKGDEDVVECWDATRGGESSWRRVRPATYRDDFGFDDGPRATPAVVDGRVYVFGAEGTLACVGLDQGEVLWSVSVVERFGAEKGFFGFACSPLVVGGRVMLNVGGPRNSGVVAMDAGTGKIVWQATGHEAGYASPVLAGSGETASVVFFTREGLVQVGLGSGRVEIEHPWRSRQGASVNAATPLLVGNRVFLTASYGTGAVLLERPGPEATGASGKGVRVVWSGDDRLSSHYASVVHREGFVYGFHGRQESGALLRCVELATGKVRWTAEPMGSGTLILAGDRLLVLTERGELCVVPATADGFRVEARAQVLGTGVRAAGALAGGRYYARDGRRMVCLELGEGTP